MPSAMCGVLVQSCVMYQVLCVVSRRMVLVALALRNACFDGFRIGDRPESAEIRAYESAKHPGCRRARYAGESTCRYSPRMTYVLH